MVDRLSLEILGFIFGAITAVVMGIGVFVVHAQLQNRTSLDGTADGTAAVLSAQKALSAGTTLSHAAIIPVALSADR